MKSKICEYCGHDESYHRLFDYSLGSCVETDCPCKKFKEKIGCGREMDFNFDIGQAVHCGDWGPEAPELCKDCKKPQNHSPDDLSRKGVNPDKGKIAQDTPDGADKSSIGSSSSGTKKPTEFKLSEKKSHLARGRFYHEIYVKTFIKKCEERSQEIVCPACDDTKLICPICKISILDENLWVRLGDIKDLAGDELSK